MRPQKEFYLRLPITTYQVAQTDCGPKVLELGCRGSVEGRLCAMLRCCLHFSVQFGGIDVFLRIFQICQRNDEAGASGARTWRTLALGI